MVLVFALPVSIVCNYVSIKSPKIAKMPNMAALCNYTCYFL